MIAMARPILAATVMATLAAACKASTAPNPRAHLAGHWIATDDQFQITMTVADIPIPYDSQSVAGQSAIALAADSSAAVSVQGHPWAKATCGLMRYGFSGERVQLTCAGDGNTLAAVTIVDLSADSVVVLNLQMNFVHQSAVQTLSGRQFQMGRH